MAQIIFDFGSGNSCRNDWLYTKRMIDELRAIDTGKHSIVIKWQLFQQVGDNIPLDRGLFGMAYRYAKELGYKTTSSVFDKESLNFLLQFDVPFVKIANRRDLDWLIGEVPRKVPVYVSASDALPVNADVILQCVSKYPAEMGDYEKNKQIFNLHNAVSDHTTNFDLWYRYRPAIIEWHLKLPDSTGLDAGPFARTPEQLREVL